MLYLIIYVLRSSKCSQILSVKAFSLDKGKGVTECLRSLIRPPNNSRKQNLRNSICFQGGTTYCTTAKYFFAFAEILETIISTCTKSESLTSTFKGFSPLRHRYATFKFYIKVMEKFDNLKYFI